MHSMHAFYNFAFNWHCEEISAARHMKGGSAPGGSSSIATHPLTTWVDTHPLSKIANAFAAAYTGKPIAPRFT